MEAFPEGVFRSPCSREDLERAQAEIGQALPSQLVDLYVAFNGFLGTTRSAFFWPLFPIDKVQVGLVRMNQFLREEAGVVFPETIVLHCLFFGDDGIGGMWGIMNDRPTEIIKWDPKWGTNIEHCGKSPLEAWLIEKKLYDEIE